MACTLRRIAVYLNGKRQFAAEINTNTEYILACSDLVEVLKNDVITVVAYQESGAAIDITSSIQLHRVTWVTKKKEVGRNTEESDDGASGGSPGSGCSGCNESTIPVPTGPPWYQNALSGKPKCFSENTLLLIESALNNNNFSLEVNSSGQRRGRAYLGYPVPDFSKYVDLVRPDCGWGFIQHGF